MKNNQITHGYERARIYRQQYKPSLSLVRLIRSILCIFINGQGMAAGHDRRMK